MSMGRVNERSNSGDGGDGTADAVEAFAVLVVISGADPSGSA